MLRARRADARRDREWDRYDTAIVTAVAIATIFVHPVRTMLRHPYWFDEAWVAALTRAPLTRLPRLELERARSASSCCLKLVPGSGLQRGRLVVLGFSVLTVVGRLRVHAHARVGQRRSSARFAATVVGARS